ncbi:toll/interleukin-1 receptor domain-containing protein [Sphingomonas sanguinis]|uniref:Toll/interleukin-1 receptor domain-containing protein n=1 Tax=Sphingomonas sanguinis TaxID=33051 RepID=A0ABU5LU99_9SPHN|nr:toll/interleukin-1 receptor domain-containing protein [Sphingomonas sanguinis]MDZ7283502.1 toll/interleukin-1 receptor domain-containing protein [Sphingomonas sanguinis]
MTKIWLTYAWKDNEEEDVDHIIAELSARGLDVGYDRVELLAGRRLWEQIDVAIKDPGVVAWAIYVTENSLKSEPCQEELAYALDRALRTRGAKFPLIGLFPGNLDREIIPSAIATRLYVNLRTNDWAEQVVNAVKGARRGSQSPPTPYGHALHKRPNGYCLEVWPRTGTWSPSYGIVPEAEAEKLRGVSTGPRGVLDGMRMVIDGEGYQNGVFGRVINNPVDAVNSLQINLAELPSWIEFGPASGQRFRLFFQ